MPKLPQCAFDYLREATASGQYATHTVEMHMSNLRAFLEFYQGDPIRARKEDILNWIQDESNKTQSDLQLACVDQKFRGLGAFYKFLLREQYISSNPCAGISLKTPERPEINPPDQRDCQVLIDSPYRLLSKNRTNEHDARLDALALRLPYFCGLGVVEMARLRMQDVLREGRKIQLHVCGRRKTLWRIVDVPCQVVRPLEDYLLIRPNVPIEKLFIAKTGNAAINRQAFRDRFAKHVAESGLPESITPIQLRHACAANKINDGMDIPSLAKFLGHTSTAFTQRYSSAGLHSCAKAINSIPFPLL